MNSIYRPRRRPRVDSVSFDSFAWVLVREALVNVLLLDRQSTESQTALRRWLSGIPTYRVRKIAEGVLARHPDWRIK